MKVTYKYQKAKPSTPHEVRFWIPAETDVHGNETRKGRYKRYYRKTKQEALKLKQELQTQLDKQGVESVLSSREDQELARQYKSAISLIPKEITDITLAEIVREWLTLTNRTVEPVPLIQALESYVTLKQGEVSPEYLKCRIETPFRLFSKNFPGAKVHEIEEPDLLEFLEEMHLEYAEETINDRLVIYRSFFKWAVEKGYTRTNPAANIPRQFVRDETPKHLTPGAVKKFFIQALRDDPEIVPALALNFFGFLRPSEIVRIVSDFPEDIRPEAREVYVRREVTKGIQGKRRARLISEVPLPLLSSRHSQMSLATKSGSSGVPRTRTWVEPNEKSGSWGVGDLSLRYDQIPNKKKGWKKD